jgi:hypothetical protein
MGNHVNRPMSWFYPEGTRYIAIPEGSDHLLIIPITTTPQSTRFELWAK